MLGLDRQDLLEPVEESIHNPGIELVAAPIAQDPHGFVVRERGLVGTLARHGVEHIGDGADAPPQRDVLAGEPARIAAAVPSLMVAQRDDPAGLQELR